MSADTTAKPKGGGEGGALFPGGKSAAEGKPRTTRVPLRSSMTQKITTERL